jgi:UDP-N-acetyl-D-mannosaminuronate dehydrogenase
MTSPRSSSTLRPASLAVGYGLVVHIPKTSGQVHSRKMDPSRGPYTAFGKSIVDAKVAILGVAFLQNSDDTRNTPTDTAYRYLKAKGANVVCHDHLVSGYEDLLINQDLDECLRDADAVVMLTLHDIYKDITVEQLGASMATKVIIDGRNWFDDEKIQQA